MYTVIPRPQITEPAASSDKRVPKPTIIDHRETDQGKWKDRKRHEQLPYATLKQHRDTLLEAEIQYKKRIKYLEDETANLVKTYEATYTENKQLRSIIEYGPDAVKMKKLNKDKKEQKGIIEQLQDDNKALLDKLSELEKKYGPPNDKELQKEWNERLAKIKKKREAEDALPIQGPFTVGGNTKPKRVTINDKADGFQDEYDLHLDTLEKEAHVLVNKIKSLKREKHHIDWAIQMGNGAVTRNAVIANSINEKLNRDLNRFAIRLEKLKIKHSAAKSYHDVHAASKTVVSKSSPGILMGDDQSTRQSVISPVDNSPKIIKSYKKRKIVNMPTTESQNEETMQPSPHKETNHTNTKSDNLKNTNSTPNEHAISTNSPDTASKAKAKVKTLVEYTLDGRKASSGNSGTVGRFSHGPEPIPWKRANKQSDTKTMAPNSAPTKLRKALKKNSPLRKDSKHIIEEPSYDTVLAYLRNRQNQNDSPVRFTEDYGERAGRQTISPVPIRFMSNGQVLDQNEVRLIMGNTGIRRDSYYKIFQ